MNMKRVTGYEALRWVFCLLMGLLMFMFVLEIPLDLPVRDLGAAMQLMAMASEVVPGQFNTAVAVAVALIVTALVAIYRLPDALKQRLLYIKGAAAYPSRKAFFGDFSKSPVDRNVMLELYPEIKEAAYDPELQHQTWLKLFETHRKKRLVAVTNRVWLLMRDLYIASLVFLLGLIAAFSLHGAISMGVAMLYLYLFGAQSLFLMLSARGTLRRLVTNVLYLELKQRKPELFKA